MKRKGGAFGDAEPVAVQKRQREQHLRGEVKHPRHVEGRVGKEAEEGAVPQRKVFPKHTEANEDITEDKEP